MDWITNNYQLLVGIFGWPILAGLFLVIRKVAFRNLTAPLIVFDGPIVDDSEFFGRTYYLSVKNVALSNLQRIICTRRSLNECHMEANFILGGKVAKHYTWWTDPDLNPNGGTLLPNSFGHTIDLVTKKRGNITCNIGTVALEPDERLPQNSDVTAEVTLFNGRDKISTSRWIIKNYGTQLSDLNVTRIVVANYYPHST